MKRPVPLLALVALVVAAPAAAKPPKPSSDRTPPTISISAPAPGSALSGTVTVSGSAGDNRAVARVELSVDGGAPQLASGTTSWSASVSTAAYAPGTHTLTARATDTSGNTASTSETVTVRDTVAPSVQISQPSGPVSGVVTVSGTAADDVGVASVSVAVDGGAAQPATGGASWSYRLDTTALANGAHAVVATALDAAGNAGKASATIDVENDVTAPSVAIITPQAGATISGQVAVTGTASDDRSVASVAVSVDGGAYQPAQGTTSWSFGLSAAALAAGSHTIAARATDGAGHATTASVSVLVAAPALPPPPGIADQLVTPEGATIQVASDVSGWTAQQIYDLLRPNALELARIGPSLTIKVQTTYASSNSVSASQTNGVYTSFRATIYLRAVAGTVFPARPDDVIAHEYGCVWALYHLYMSQQGKWNPWLSARGLLGDPRLDSSFSWSRNEMIADDYRMLFGTPAAQSEAAYVNPDVPDPRSVPGLRDFFLSVWALP